ncbi:MAG: DUF1553 domain-containing protein, partial [Planctomycetota bacterium]
DDEKPARHCGLTEEEQGRLKVREQDQWIWKRRLERYQPMVQSVFNGKTYWMNARKLRKPGDKKNDLNWRPESVIFSGGDYQAKGEAVTPGVLSGCSISVPGAPSDDPYALPTTQEGRRLGLAKWIASPNNPLSMRSYVNRIWQYHFGRGIVKTANNFGVKGDRPSHPELLDYLTAKFVEDGMSTKALHRMILLSDVYKRDARTPDPEKRDLVDPSNKLLSSFPVRRLSAEEIRDVMLLVTGELNFSMGGLPVMPEINREVALEPRMIQFSLAPAYQASPKPETRNRRSIYAYRVRGQADPFMEIMNKPGPNESCALRDDAAVSPQAFTLLNSDVMSDRSIAMAIRLRGDHSNLSDQISSGFEWILGRSPSEEEASRLSEYVREMIKHHQSISPDSVSYPTEITRSLVEEFSGKPFEYTEWLPNFENYVPDAKAADVDPPTRALADLCLILFNTNEFMYVD